jgi:serine-type D-Ala-D-Ala carboxypeptidase
MVECALLELEQDEEIGDLLREMIEAGVVSAATGLIACQRRILSCAWVGEGLENALYDLGSLTKVFTATLAATLHQQGTLPFDTTVADVFPDADRCIAGADVVELLGHRAGLQAWYPFYATCEGREDVLRLLLSGELCGAPEPTVYSDLDLILYGFMAETVTGVSLAELFRGQVLDPLDLHATAPCPGRDVDLAPCHLDNGEEVRLAAELGIEVEYLREPPPGVVQDGNARFLGGLSGHAGLFSTVSDVHRLALEWLDPGRLLTCETVELALSGADRYALVWLTQPEPGMLGSSFSPEAFGHTGFPGGSTWIDPIHDRIYVLLAHKTSSEVEMKPWRQEFQSLLR